MGFSALTLYTLIACSTFTPTPQTQGFAEPESQAQRNVRIQRLEILPSNARIALGASIIYIAVAQEKDNVPVAGVTIRWRAYDADNRELALSQQGKFSPKMAGIYRIVATDGKHEAHTSLTVDDARTRNSAPSLLSDRDSGWDDSSAPTAFEPGQQRGHDPYATRRDGLISSASVRAYQVGNSNFTLSVPVVALPGRGLDLNLALHYNSNLWHKSGRRMRFNIDADWPAPGWSLGFERLVFLGSNPEMTMLIDADGTRHPFTTTHGEVTGYHRKSADGTLIRLYYESSSDHIVRSAYAYYPNGTVVEFTAPSTAGRTLYATSIRDRNGNYLTITYRNNNGPELERVVDTLGRILSFHYDADNHLTAIVGPGLASSPQELIRLHYKNHALRPKFDPQTIEEPVAPDRITVLDAVYYPGTRRGYWFGTSDSYSAYGMLTKVLEQRGMGFSSASLDEQGHITEGSNTRQQWYNYPSEPDPSLPGAPTYTKLGECWEKMDKGSSPEADVLNCPSPMAATSPAISKFLIADRFDYRWVEVILPEGTALSRFTHRASPGGAGRTRPWQQGLVFGEYTYDYLHDWKLLQTTLTSWEPGNGNGPRKTRVEVIDELSQRKAVEYGYGPEYNQIAEVREYGYGDYGKLAWSSAGQIPGKKCLWINEPSEPDYWHDNYLCSDADYGFLWSDNGPIADKHCIPINELADPDSWDNNFLCMNRDYGFHWSSAGPIPGEDCTQIVEPLDPHTWNDNFLCRNTTGLLRTTRTGYGSPQFGDAWIVNIPVRVEVFSADSPSVVARTEYRYDEPDLNDAPGVVQHIDVRFPTRGNLTTITKFPDTAKPENTIVERRRYDITGNLLGASTISGEETRYTYTSATQYAYPESTTMGSPDPNSPDRLTSSTSYDFNTGLLLWGVDTNGRMRKLEYDPQTLRLSRETRTTSGSNDYETTFSYDDAALRATQETTSEGRAVSKSISWVNGLGLTRRTDALTKPGSSGGPDELSVSETKYDLRGRVWKQSRPWLRKGDQPRDGLEWSYGSSNTLPNPTFINGPEKPDYWKDNVLATDKNYGFAWSTNGPIAGKHCILIDEPSDPQGWDNNYLCADGDYGLQWSYAGRIAGKACLQFEEPSDDRPQWNDNFLCMDKQYGQVIQWSETAYDALGRITFSKAPDGSNTFYSYNGPILPPGASSNPGTRMGSIDNWQRERWTRTDALGRLVEVVQGGNSTAYDYNALDKLVRVNQGVQTRRFQYDSMGRLTHQYHSEKTATLNDEGKYVGDQGQWSDVFSYDTRSNLITHVDARGVNTIYDYADDPLDRLQDVTYDTSRFGDTGNPIVSTPGVKYTYMKEGDVSRVRQVDVEGVGTETYAYQPSGLLKSKTLTLTSQPSHPFDTDYAYDRLDRLMDTQYPKRYSVSGDTRGIVHYDYDIAGRIAKVTADGNEQASGMSYNAASQLTGIEIGAPALSEHETYDYEENTGLVSRQWVRRGDKSLLDLSYEYLPLPCTGLCVNREGRSGQLTRMVNKLTGKSYEYDYDTFGRLISAVGNDPPFPDRTAGRPGYWKQKYSYKDAYGNRTAVDATRFRGGTYTCPPGPGACEPPEEPASSDMRDGLASVSYDETTNRITNPGFAYDAAGNLVRLPRQGGTSYQFQYDAAGRLSVVRDSDGVVLFNYTYGPDRKRWITKNAVLGGRTFYRWEGDAVIAEYNKESSADASAPPTAALNYVYLGNRLLSTLRPKNLLDNPQFETVGLSGPSTTFTGLRGDAKSAAATWYVWNNVYGTTTTDLVRSTFPSGGANMIYVTTTGTRSGLVQTFPNNAAPRVTASAWVFVKRGRVGIGSGNAGGTDLDVESSTTNRWEYLEAKNGTSPANEFIVYASSNDGAEFYVAATSVSEGLSTEPEVQYWHPDRLGTRLITNGQDSEVIEQATFPFGVSLDSETSPSAQNLTRRFTSYDREVNRTKLDYAVNRFYDSEQGRFTQPDPIGMAAASLKNPQTLNMYSYIHGDPVNGTDSIGLEDIRQCIWFEGVEVCGGPTITVTAPESLTGGKGLEPIGGPKDTMGRERGRNPNGPGGGVTKMEKNQSRNICKDMASIAQQYANQAILANPGNPPTALQLFDQAFSQLYVGRPLNSVSAAVHLVSDERGLPNRGISTNYLGQSGFHSYALDNDLGILADQTHHFATYLSGGINMSTALDTILNAHMLGDLGQLNLGDIALGATASAIGQNLQRDPASLANIGEQIQTSICE